MDAVGKVNLINVDN